MDQNNPDARGTLDEFGLIRHLTGRLQPTRRQPRVGIGDDAAVMMQQAGEDALVTTDTMVEGVHFLPSTMSFADLGHKCVAVSISDIAAMGGEPRWAVLSLAIPKGLPLSALEQLYDGVSEVCAAYDCPLVGGDVVRTEGPMVLTSTVIGAVPAGTALLRSGARPGDVVFVTGTVGGSAAGLALLLAQGRETAGSSTGGAGGAGLGSVSRPAWAAGGGGVAGTAVP
ncbi:MAG: thiamine-phosphate kinase, partial [Alicyclobacillaceae bacterium]|nr:thiamine-phosphate kinase [Alicyclobacillaceae bacterium]